MRLSLLPLLILSSLTLAALPYKGADWSSTLHLESSGQTFKSASGATQPLENILKSSGINTVRQRLWVNPSNGNYNLDYNLRLARRAKAAGLKVYLDLHYSDTWADPAHQDTPAAWKGLSKDALVKKVYEYTQSVVNAFSDAGLPLDIISIGNEITPGLLFPIGKLGDGKGDAGRNVAALLSSASKGVRESKMSPKPKIMIHLDNGWKWETQKWWYDSVYAGGLSPSAYDIQGVSYYPFYSADASLSNLSTSLKNMRQKYGKEVMVVETNWPSWCPNPAYAFPADTKGIPISAEGQAQWVKEVAKRVGEAGGTGVFYWEPAWVGNAGLGSSCGWNLMFGDDGKAMSSLAVFNSI